MIVYHYCSLESLNSILKNRSLRLTNILKSNDSMEISWNCRYLKELMKILRLVMYRIYLIRTYQTSGKGR